MTIGIIKYAIEFCVTINQALSQEKVDSSKFIGELFAGKYTYTILLEPRFD